MRQHEVFNKIGVILKELNDQYKYLEANPDDMNSLELELFVANAHFLADHAEIINKLNLQTVTAKPALPPAPKETPKTEEKFFEPVVRQPARPQPLISVEQQEPPVINFDFSPAKTEEPAIEAEPEMIRHELDMEEIEDWDDEEDADLEVEENVELEPEPVESVVVAEKTFIVEAEEPEVKIPELPAAKAPEPRVEVEPVKHESVKEEVLTINQRMSAQLNKGGVTDQPAGQPVADLKHAISLNDKLSYIKDLFNGYNLAYSEAIEILNRLSSFEDAERFLSKNYVTKNNWESKPDTVARFYAVLKRRYM